MSSATCRARKAACYPGPKARPAAAREQVAVLPADRGRGLARNEEAPNSPRTGGRDTSHSSAAAGSSANRARRSRGDARTPGSPATSCRLQLLDQRWRHTTASSGDRDSVVGAQLRITSAPIALHEDDVMVTSAFEIPTAERKGHGIEFDRDNQALVNHSHAELRWASPAPPAFEPRASATPLRSTARLPAESVPGLEEHRENTRGGAY